MNVEKNRLETFHEWPHDAVVSPSRIAKAGFFYTKQQLTVECFSCKKTISEWNYGDQVMARHKLLNPTCPFVLNPTTSGNVPTISQPTSVPSSSVSHDLMKDEATRLKTFGRWPIPHIVSAERLARAGFYYLNMGDNTKCAFCKGVVRAWEVGDDPDQEHRRHFGDCPFVLTEIIPRISLNAPNISEGCDVTKNASFSNLNLVANDNLHSLGVQTHKGPKKSNYATIEARFKSFHNWPPDLIQTPDILAQAGFYYEGLGDQVRCFHCDGGLRHWDPQDDPWTEHARWFPRCSFIKLVKGQDFVTACSLELNLNSNLEEIEKSTSLPSKRRQVTERELQQYMTSEVALSALSIGLNVERVKRAIREKLEHTGRGYSQPDALVEAALNLQHDEEDMSSDQEIAESQMKHLVDNVLDSVMTKSSSNGVRKDDDDGLVENHVLTERKDLSTVNKAVSLEEENRILKEARLCKICMDAEVGIVFLPCGHLTTCVNCAPNLEDCPVCRSAIKATVRTFLS